MHEARNIPDTEFYLTTNLRFTIYDLRFKKLQLVNRKS